ncbi:MAG: thymidylate synthase [Thermoproteota archaeon]
MKELESIWPLYYKDELIVGNPKSNVAICTLWTKKELFSDLPREKFAVIGNLRTTYGINPLIKNVLANPRIRFILVCGEDLMKTGSIIINFFNNGVDEDYQIIGTQAYIDKNIPKEAIETLRKNVQILDLRNEKNLEKLKEKIVNILNEVSREEEPFSKPIVIGEKEKEVETLFSEDKMFRVEGEAISEVWLKALDLVMKFGEVKQTEYNLRQKEVLGIVSVINGEETELPSWLPVSKEDLENYYLTFFNQVKPEGVEYTYGERLFGLKVSSMPENVRSSLEPKMVKEAHAILDQVEFLVKKLREKPFTRRAIAVTWRHESDLVSANPPCLIEIVWSIKFGKLHQMCTFRSHDIFGAWLLNVFALRKLQHYVSDRVRFPIGSLIVVSVSAHVYENNWNAAEEILEKHYRKKKMEFNEDPRGFFVIKVKSNEIVVEHRLKDGRKTKYEFRGNSAEELYRRILNENLVSRLDHAAYLGKELARAEIALRERKPYVQDKA